MKQMIAYCGLDCEKCDAYLATVKNDDALRAKTARLWAEMNNAPITPEMINCLGCRVDGVKTPFCDYMCSIRQCARKTGVATCADCQKMQDCKTVAEILDNSAEAKSNLGKK